MLYIPVVEQRRLLQDFDSSNDRLKDIESYYISLLEDEEKWDYLSVQYDNISGGGLDTRRVQDDKRQNITFKQCLFQSNRVNGNKYSRNGGVVAVKSAYNDLTIDECRFTDNAAGSSNADGVSSMQPSICFLCLTKDCHRLTMLVFCSTEHPLRCLRNDRNEYTFHHKLLLPRQRFHWRRNGPCAHSK